MSPPLRAALWYFGLIYALGFALGTARELLLTPRFGTLAPRLVELPVMLVASWFAAGFIVGRHRLSGRAHRLVTGLAAFALLMAGEALVGIGLAGRSPGEHLLGYLTLQGGLTLAAQSAFAIFPLLVRPGRSTAVSDEGS